ncbi:MAG: hypothetical protein J0G96_15195 [Flavobacteriia bacterium]|uniref:hypothetical protein n=1 Tax=uncultured Flavobacterium sp. TaxID=165435 RepID=UPI0009674D69|nr:hypothetical protein [uncultured Flavobacterium sp.]MBN9295322.1 hypothetical protein [Flavobacteriia bacterium]OJX36689.1 MAG: hypothetical protein BGO87_12900 [Flavobacteriia bacterium 40-80]
MNHLDLSLLKSVFDEFIGELSFNIKTDDWLFKLREDFNTHFVTANSVSDNVIAVILESPHIHEFENVSLTSNDGQNIKSRPLNNIKSRDSLIYILENVMTPFYDKNKVYKVVLINAVQFQTSLGGIDKDIRNENWLKIWINKKGDFLRRINEVNPTLIFNLCTQGSYKKEDESFQEINDQYLKSFGLKFATVNEEQVLFEVRKLYDKEKFTLQDAVEYVLENEKLISNINYSKYYHPSKFTFGKSPCFPVLDKKNKINFCKSTLKICLTDEAHHHEKH